MSITTTAIPDQPTRAEALSILRDYEVCLACNGDGLVRGYLDGLPDWVLDVLAAADFRDDTGAGFNWSKVCALGIEGWSYVGLACPPTCPRCRGGRLVMPGAVFLENRLPLTLREILQQFNPEGKLATASEWRTTGPELRGLSIGAASPYGG